MTTLTEFVRLHAREIASITTKEIVTEDVDGTTLETTFWEVSVHFRTYGGRQRPGPYQGSISAATFHLGGLEELSLALGEASAYLNQAKAL